MPASSKPNLRARPRGVSAWAAPEWRDGHAVASDSPKRRFLTLDQITEEFAISKGQTYPLVRRRELRAVKIDGRAPGASRPPARRTT